MPGLIAAVHAKGAFADPAVTVVNYGEAKAKKGKGK